MDYNGDFVVTWTDDLTSGGQDVRIQLFDPNGLPLVGGPLPSPGGPGVHRQHESHVAMDAQGDFVVSYTYDFSAADQDVFYQRGDLAFFLLGGPVPVATTPLPEHHSSVTTDFYGDFAIAYQKDVGVTSEIHLLQYTFSGGLVSNLTVAAGGLDQYPNVAMDNVGTTVVVYQDWNGSNWDTWGAQVPFGWAFPAWQKLLWSSGDDLAHPVVAVNRSSDTFVVAFQDDTLGSVQVAEYDPLGNLTGGPWDVGGGRSQPAVSIDGAGYYQLTYTLAGPTSNIDSWFGIV
jgi:hypothetical protein